MEKYGVDENTPTDGEKRAKTAQPITCPICGQEAQVEGSVYLCPKHGSAPWEGDPRDSSTPAKT